MLKILSICSERKAALFFLSTLLFFFALFTKPDVAEAFLAKASVLEQTDEIEHPLLEPLSPDDPRAQLDPNLLNIPPIRPPKTKYRKLNISASYGTREVYFDVSTQTEYRGDEPEWNAVHKPQKSLGTGQKTLRVPGDLGSNLNEDVLTDLIHLEKVIGKDDRQKIADTTKYPWRTICKLYMTFPNGSQYIGSGTLIASKYVLTAGHCVYSKADGGWAKSIQVIPGLNGTYKPYGSAWAARLRTYTGWTSNENSDHDFALITLKTNIGDSTGWLGYAYYSNINGVTGNLSGYPGDLSNGLCQYYHYGPILSSTQYRVYYKIDTYGGQSGSGVYRIAGGNRYVFAVHTTGYATQNGGTRIDKNKFDSIKSWIASGS